jgi:error-prone DNA polymerase
MGKHLLPLVQSILGFPRHLSQHVGGFIISSGPLSELVPVENAAMADRTVIQWDKDDLESLGLLKVDVLALGMLTAIRKCFQLLSTPKHHFTMDQVEWEQAAVYNMLQRGDSIGVFQVE